MEIDLFLNGKSKRNHDNSSEDSGKRSHGHRRKRRELIVENESEELPFASHTFNKKQQEADRLHDGRHHRIGKRNLFDQLMEYKHHSGTPGKTSSSDSLASSFCSFATSQSDNNARLPYENDYEFQVSKQINSSTPFPVTCQSYTLNMFVYCFNLPSVDGG